MRVSFEYLTETALKPAGYWTTKEVMQFHYFNENGVIARYKRLCDEIDSQVEAGNLKTGWILAYGGLSGADKAFMDLYNKPRRTRIEVSVCIKMLNDHCDRAGRKLNEELD